jgi:hypothetical protein
MAKEGMGFPLKKVGFVGFMGFSKKTLFMCTLSRYHFK